MSDDSTSARCGGGREPADPEPAMPDTALAMEIRRLRAAAGLSQNQLADKIGYTRQYVSRAERPSGGQVSAELVRVIDAALGAGGALVQLHASLLRRRIERRTESSLPAAVVASASRVFVAASVDAPTKPPPGLGQTSTGIDEEIEVAAEEASRFVRRAGTGVTTELVEELQADVRRLAVAYLARPPFQMFRPLAMLRAEVFDLLDQHPRLDVRRDLYTVGGQVSALLAHASSDLGHPDAADSHARTAWLCADLVGDRKLAAYTRWIQSNIAYWSGDYVNAARIASRAQDLIEDDDDRIRLTSQEARAHAASGDQAATDAALFSVGILREQARSGRVPTASGVFHFGAGKAAYYASEARLTLGGTRNVRQAVLDARDAVTVLTDARHSGGAVELIAAARLDLAAALLASHELEAAVDEVALVLATPPESRTVPIIGRVSSIDSVIAEQFVNISLAIDLRDRIKLFSAYPAARELPAAVEAELG